MIFREKVLCFFLLSFWSINLCQLLGWVGAWSHACGRPQVFCINITMTSAYSFSWRLPQNVLLVNGYLLLVLTTPCAFFRMRNNRSNSQVKNFLSPGKSISTVTKSRWSLLYNQKLLAHLRWGSFQSRHRTLSLMSTGTLNSPLTLNSEIKRTFVKPEQSPWKALGKWLIVRKN